MRCPIRSVETVDTKWNVPHGMNGFSVEAHSKSVHHSRGGHFVRLADTHDAVQAESLKPEVQGDPPSFGRKAAGSSRHPISTDGITSGRKVGSERPM